MGMPQIAGRIPGTWIPPGRGEQHGPHAEHGAGIGHEHVDPSVDHPAGIARDLVTAVNALPRAQVVTPEMARAGQYPVAYQPTRQRRAAMGAYVRDGHR